MLQIKPPRMLLTFELFQKTLLWAYDVIYVKWIKLIVVFSGNSYATRLIANKFYIKSYL